MLQRVLLSMMLCMAGTAAAYEPAPAVPATASQFTFAWPLGEDALKPRGSSTKGVPVILDTAPSAAWTALQAPGIDAHERDRRAILAMAGEYRVSFDFLEMLRFDPALKPDAPYQSWGTELVMVSADQPDFVSLQHILVMRMLDKDGRASEPMVMRHWRQVWRYQPASMLTFEANNRWDMTPLDATQRDGAWVQSVFQVDDSPRYSSVGRWQHNASFSTWIGDETLRPLPRREFSVRKDYQALLGTNRHTVTATGWVQEENNLKLALDATGKARATLPYLAREYGVARYERINDTDFAPGRAYFDKTEPFWALVRAGWASAVARDGHVTLVGPVDQKQLFVPFFERAQAIADGEKAFDAAGDAAFVETTLRETYFTK